MVHDVTQSDLWYHDAEMPTCIMRNYLIVLRDHDLSPDEQKEIIDKLLIQVEKNKKILYEEYLEKRRLENK
jgi:hypothetical protein